MSNNSLDHYIDDFRIAGALINKYLKRIIPNYESSLMTTKKMLNRLNRPNDLIEFVTEHNLKLKSQHFFKINISEINDFPKLDVNDIENDIIFGKYQLGQCISYLSSMFREKDNVYVYLNKDESIFDNFRIIYSDIPSRHIGNKKYRTYVKYVRNVNLSEAIQGWICECKVGHRTLGCCSHITAVIYYLSYGKYQAKLDDPGSTLLRILGINVSEDDSEDEDHTEYIESYEDF